MNHAIYNSFKRAPCVLVLASSLAACGSDSSSAPSSASQTTPRSGQSPEGENVPPAGPSSGTTGDARAPDSEQGEPSRSTTGEAGADGDRYAAVLAVEQAFRDDAYDQYAALVAAIDQAAEQYPDDAVIARHAATLRLWRLAERERDPAFGLIDAGLVLGEAKARFARAMELAPNDGRLDGWSASLTMLSGLAVGSASEIEKGKAELEASIESYPTFNLFVQAAALGALPPSDPDFAEAPEKLYAALETCGYTFDRESPVWVFPDAPPPAGLPCDNDSGARHNLEGFFLTMGDILTKAGDVEKARIHYENARSVPSFADWRLRDLLDARIADLQKNADSFLDEDPSNDFKTAIEDGYFCVGCHAE